MSRTDPRVSVVIPAFNAEGTVGQAILSALTQELPVAEVIIVDDGSTDATAEAAGSIADSRIRVISQPNAGSAAARNTGIIAANGDWIAFLDADDVWLPQKLWAQFDALASRPEARAVQSGAHFTDEALRVLFTRRCTDRSEGNLLDFLRFVNLPACCSTWAVERSLIAEIDGFDTGLPSLEDWDFSIRLALHDEPVSVSEPLILYRQHAGNRSLDIDALAAAGQQILRKVFADDRLPAAAQEIEREVHARLYTMLCGGALRTGRWSECAGWGLRALLTDPRVSAYMAAMPARRVTRRLAATTLPVGGPLRPSRSRQR